MRLPSGKRRLPILLLTQPQGRCRAASWHFSPTRSHHDSPPRAIGTKGIFADCCEATSSPTLSLEIHIERKAWKDVKQSFFLRQKISLVLWPHDAGRLGGYLAVWGSVDLHYPQPSWKYFVPSNTFCLAKHLGQQNLYKYVSTWLVAEFQWDSCGQFSGARFGFFSHEKNLYELCWPKGQCVPVFSRSSSLWLQFLKSRSPRVGRLSTFWLAQNGCMNIAPKTPELDPFIRCAHENEASVNYVFKHNVGILNPKDLKIT